MERTHWRSSITSDPATIGSRHGQARRREVAELGAIGRLPRRAAVEGRRRGDRNHEVLAERGAPRLHSTNEDDRADGHKGIRKIMSGHCFVPSIHSATTMETNTPTIPFQKKLSLNDELEPD